MSIKPIILTVLFCVPFLAMADESGIPPIELKGVVSEDGSGKSLKGAVISIEKNGQVIHSTQSDENGEFSLSFEGPISRFDKVTISVSKQGYRTQDIKTIHHDNDISIKLDKIPKPIPLLMPLKNRSFTI